MSVIQYSEIVPLVVLAGPGAIVGLVAIGSVLRERRIRASRLGEVRHLNEMLRVDEEAHSPALRGHYEARLGEAIGGFTVHDYARSPEVRREVDAHLWRLGKGAGGRKGER